MVLKERRVLEGLLAAQKIPALIFHLAWPGIGNIAKRGDGYNFVPVPLVPVL